MLFGIGAVCLRQPRQPTPYLEGFRQIPKMKAFRNIGIFTVLILCLLMLAGCKSLGKKKKKDRPFIDPVVRIERELNIYFGPLDADTKTMYHVIKHTDVE